MADCPVCGADIEPGENTIKNELMDCEDCGVELEVIEVNPFSVEEAPQEEEDWGQ